MRPLSNKLLLKSRNRRWWCIRTMAQICPIVNSELKLESLLSFSHNSNYLKAQCNAEKTLPLKDSSLALDTCKKTPNLFLFSNTSFWKYRDSFYFYFLITDTDWLNIWQGFVFLNSSEQLSRHLNLFQDTFLDFSLTFLATKRSLSKYQECNTANYGRGSYFLMLTSVFSLKRSFGTKSWNNCTSDSMAIELIQPSKHFIWSNSFYGQYSPKMSLK